MSPIRVDFYLLGGDEPKEGFVCRFLEKVYRKGHRVFVFCNHQQEAETLDELLWTFKDDAFIPHNIQGEGPIPPPPIQFGFGKEPNGYQDILLNLANEIPVFCTRFKRIIEIVPNDDAAKEISRQHYKYYRSQGFHIHTHTIDASPP